MTFAENEEVVDAGEASDADAAGQQGYEGMQQKKKELTTTSMDTATYTF